MLPNHYSDLKIAQNRDNQVEYITSIKNKKILDSTGNWLMKYVCYLAYNYSSSSFKMTLSSTQVTE
jgi:hypothetical protein